MRNSKVDGNLIVSFLSLKTRRSGSVGRRIGLPRFCRMWQGADIASPAGFVLVACCPLEVLSLSNKKMVGLTGVTDLGVSFILERVGARSVSGSSKIVEDGGSRCGGEDMPVSPETDGLFFPP